MLPVCRAEAENGSQERSWQRQDRNRQGLSPELAPPPSPSNELHKRMPILKTSDFCQKHIIKRPPHMFIQGILNKKENE